MKEFLKKDQVRLVNGGYLSNGDEKPRFNSEFVAAQQHAEYINTFAKMAKDKDFKGKQADSVTDLKAEVTNLLNASKAIPFVDAPKDIKRPTTTKLADEAMAFMKFTESSSKVEKINSFLQQFAILNEFENYGLFFEEDIVKLNKIYTMAAVIAAVTETIELLD